MLSGSGCGPKAVPQQSVEVDVWEDFLRKPAGEGGMNAQLVAEEMHAKFHDPIEQLQGAPLQCDMNIEKQAGEDWRQLVPVMRQSVKRKAWPAWGTPLECLRVAMTPGPSRARQKIHTHAAHNGDDYDVHSNDSQRHSSKWYGRQKQAQPDSGSNHPTRDRATRASASAPRFPPSCLRSECSILFAVYDILRNYFTAGIRA